MFFGSKPFGLDDCISVKDAAGYSGYNLQYVRQLLRVEQLSEVKVGQVRLID